MPKYPGIHGLSTMSAIGILSIFSRRTARLNVSHCSGSIFDLLVALGESAIVDQIRSGRPSNTYASSTWQPFWPALRHQSQRYCSVVKLTSLHITRSEERRVGKE